MDNPEPARIASRNLCSLTAEDPEHLIHPERKVRVVRILALVVLVFVVLTLWVVGSSRGEQVNTSPSFPFPAGTTWTYRYTRTPTRGPSSTGTATQTYGGTTSYRGATYHFEDETDTFTPGATERTYFTWNQVATQRADVWIGPSSDPGTYELIFGGDGIVTVGAAQATSGVAQCFFNGQDWGTVAWSASSTKAGTVTITVPAGTFTTTRWNWQVTFSGGCLTLSITASSYVVGSASEIRVDGATSGRATYSYELQSGPISRAEVWPPRRAGLRVRAMIPDARVLRSGILH